MKKSVYLDLSLPVFIDKDLAERYCTFLKSIIKLLEKSSNLKFYISLNLFNEFHLNSTYSELIKTIKNLVENDKAEIVLSSSFNISALSNEQSHVYDILYSEYFNAFNLGFPRDFEGDSCMMIKNTHTFFSPKGLISESLLNSLKMMGIERLFVDRNLVEDPCLYKGIKLVPVNLQAGALFNDFVTLETVSEFLNQNDLSINYLNLFDLFLNHNSNIETNFSNFIYLLDRGSEQWGLCDIDDENMKYQETLPNSVLQTLSIGEKDSGSYLDFKDQIIKYFSHKDLIGTEIDPEDFRRLPVWKKTGIINIDTQNMFNLHLMSLLSEEVNRKNLLLKAELDKHVNDIIDQLIVSDLCSDSLNSLFSSFKDKINLK